MPVPGYHPLTPNEHKFDICAMALGAAWFTTTAATYHESKPKTPSDTPFPWFGVLCSSLLFFISFLRLVLDSWYHGRAWWKLLFWSSGSGASGAAQLLGFTGLAPVAIGMWVWTIAMVVVVFGTGFLEERDESDAGWEAPLAGNDGDTPWKPTEN